MLSSFAAARHAALGSAASSLAASAAWRSHAAGIGMEIATCTRGDALLGQASIEQSPPPSVSASRAQPSACSVADGALSSCNGNGAQMYSGSVPGADSNLAMLARPQLCKRLAIMPGVSASTLRCFHSSAPAAGAAASAAAARAAAAAGSGPRQQGGRGGRQQLSPHASEFQRRFFQLINSTGSGADAAAAANASTTSSQAVRMLLAWLEEGRTAFAEEQKAAAAAAAGTEAAVTGTASTASTAVGIAAPYRLEQQVIDRAMEVLWRLYYAQEVVRRGGSDSGGGVEGPMELRELLTAAEGLAAAAPAMGLTFKRQHYDLLLELYNKHAIFHDSVFRGSAQRGLAQRMLNVRQHMVQQMLPLSQVSLNHILTAVRHDPEMTPATKIATAMRLIDRDLPVVTSAAPSPAASDSLLRWLQTTLHALMKDAAKEGDWTAYHRFEAVLVSRTRSLPPYDVLMEALACAAAAGKRELAAGILAQMEQWDGQRQGEQQGQGQGQGQGQWQGQGQGQQRRQLQREQVQQQGRQEAGSLMALLKVAVAAGDEKLADKVYDRLRDVAWRHLAFAVSPPAAAAAAESDWDDTDGADGTDDEEAKKAKEAREAKKAEEAKEAARSNAAAAAVAAARPAPAAATLQLLPLPLARRDWRRVVELVAGLGELQSLYRRAQLVGDLTWAVGGDAATMERHGSAYGGLRSLSEVLIGSDQDTVGYYSELLRAIAAAAAPGTSAAPFGGSPIPFGPPLRAAAARKDLSSVAEIVRQMRGLGCNPGADSYAAVIDASLRAGKPERVAGLLELMSEEKVYPSPAVWEVQLAAATEARDTAALTSVAQAAVAEADRGRVSARGVAGIRDEVLAAASAAAESAGDSRAAAALTLLRKLSEELEAAAVRGQQQQQQYGQGQRGYGGSYYNQQGQYGQGQYNSGVRRTYGGRDGDNNGSNGRRFGGGGWRDERGQQGQGQ